MNAAGEGAAGTGEPAAEGGGSAAGTGERAGVRLDGRVIVVTGASSGIGRATARRLARAGATVVVAARRVHELGSVVDEIIAAGGRASAQPVDVAAWHEMERLAAGVVERHGRLDGAFHNAGKILGHGALHATDPAGFRAAFDLNAGGAFHAIRAFVPPMIAAGGGSLVINAALSAVRPRATVGLYSAAKAAAVALAQVAAQEAAPHGVRVNAIAPGYVRSEAWDAILGPRAEALAQGVPQRRIGTPGEVAEVVTWLLSDAAAYVNGAVVPVDGGLALA